MLRKATAITSTTHPTQQHRARLVLLLERYVGRLLVEADAEALQLVLDQLLLGLEGVWARWVGRWRVWRVFGRGVF